MTDTIFWLHDKALNNDNFKWHTENTQGLFIWDEKYFQAQSYSLKRLVFIYETLCEMSVDIIQGDTIEIIQSLEPQKVITLFTPDTKVQAIILNLQMVCDVEVKHSQAFVNIPKDTEFKRFFPYWNKAKKMAFLPDGGHNA